MQGHKIKSHQSLTFLSFVTKNMLQFTKTMVVAAAVATTITLTTTTT
jgi:hypothetical protein